MINSETREIIRIFMNEAKSKHNIKSGLNPIFNDSIGLVEVCVAFEAFINGLLYSGSIFKKRENFSIIYQPKLNLHEKALEKWIIELKKELDKMPLENMTPNSNKPLISISNLTNLKEIIEVVYRVRSNLVHGSKSLDSQRNGVLISNSFHFLYSFLEIIFTEEKII